MATGELSRRWRGTWIQTATHDHTRQAKNRCSFFIVARDGSARGRAWTTTLRSRPTYRRGRGRAPSVRPRRRPAPFRVEGEVLVKTRREHGEGDADASVPPWAQDEHAVALQEPRRDKPQRRGAGAARGPSCRAFPRRRALGGSARRRPCPRTRPGSRFTTASKAAQHPAAARPAASRRRGPAPARGVASTAWRWCRFSCAVCSATTAATSRKVVPLREAELPQRRYRQGKQAPLPRSRRPPLFRSRRRRRAAAAATAALHTIVRGLFQNMRVPPKTSAVKPGGAQASSSSAAPWRKISTRCRRRHAHDGRGVLW